VISVARGGPPVEIAIAVAEPGVQLPPPWEYYATVDYSYSYPTCHIWRAPKGTPVPEKAIEIPFEGWPVTDQELEAEREDYADLQARGLLVGYPPTDEILRNRARIARGDPDRAVYLLRDAPVGYGLTEDMLRETVRTLH